MKKYLLSVLCLVLFFPAFIMAQKDSETIKIKSFVKKEKGKFGIKNGKEWVIPAVYDKITGMQFSETPEEPLNNYYYKCWKGDKFDLLFADQLESSATYQVFATDVSRTKWNSSTVDKIDQEYLFYEKNGKWGWFIRKAEMLKQNEKSYLEKHLVEARFDDVPQIQVLYSPSNGDYTDYNWINFTLDSAGYKGLFSFTGEQIFKFGPYSRFSWDRNLKIFTIRGSNGLEGYAQKGIIVEPIYKSIKKSDNIMADFACTLPDGTIEYRIGTSLASQGAVASGQKYEQMKNEAEEKRKAENARVFEFFYDREYTKKFGVRDMNGKIIVQPKYNLYGGGLNKIYEVRDESRMGFFDLSQGKEIIPLKYQQTEVVFQEGLVAVKLNGKWGYIDINDKVVIPIKYEYADSFINGKAEVILDGRMFFIDKKGNEVK